MVDEIDGIGDGVIVGVGANVGVGVGVGVGVDAGDGVASICATVVAVTTRNELEDFTILILAWTNECALKDLTAAMALGVANNRTVVVAKAASRKPGEFSFMILPNNFNNLLGN